MEDIKIFKYSKCCCCAKNYKVSALIELDSTTSLEISEETLNFSDLFLDTCFVKFDNSKLRYICESCKEQLIMFHMFKRDVRKYSSFHEHIKKLDVLAKVEEYLSNMENINDLTVYQHDNTILITKNTDDYVEQDILQIDKNCIIDDQMVIEEVPLKCNLEEEYIEEIHEDQIDDIEVSSSIKVKSDGFEEIHSDYSFKDERSESYQSSSESPQAKIRKKYVYKVNTNDSLTGEQMSWLKQQVSKSQIIVNGKKLFKCQLCGTVLQIPGSLKKHLRDSHLLKSKEEENERAFRRAFKQEISNSKIEVNPKEGLEFIWKCQRCTDDRIFRSESGLKVHLRYTHIRSQVIDADFVAGCKISIENGKQIKNAWQCPECSKILRSRDGLRNHLKVEHPLLVDKLQTSTDLKDDLEKNVNLEKSQSTSWMSEKLSKVHPRSTHKNENRYVCSPCGLQFVNGSTKRDKSLEIHQQLHIILKTVSQSYELPKCEQCKVMFSNNEDLANHLINHDPDDVFVAEGLSLLVAVKYSEPIGTASNDDFDNWKCGHCAHARFKEEIECIEHQMILHSKQMICPIDYLEFNGIRGLSQFSIHMKNKHLEMFPDLTIACSYCHHEFPNIFDKLTHMKSCDRKEFACDHCPKKFFNKTQLLRHLKIVSGVISFSCDVCQKKCVSAMDLKLHFRSHTNEKTYQCTFPNCKKVFKTPAARSSHMEIHSFIEYECSDCKAIFKQRALLQRHLKHAKCKGEATAGSFFS